MPRELYDGEELLDFQRSQIAFAGHLRNPDEHAAPSDVEDRRLAIYRDLFYNNIEGLLSSTFPVVREILPDNEWHGVVREYFSEHRSHTPLFPEVAEDFLGFIQAIDINTRLRRPFLLELAHYEWMELVAGLEDEDIQQVQVNRGGDLLAGVPVLSPLAWLLSYQYPVHKISTKLQPKKPEAAPVLIVVYRNRDDDVRFMEINPVTMRLLQLIEENQALAAPAAGQVLVEALAAEMQHADPSALLQPALEIMNGMLARDILLGTQQG